MYCLSAVLAWIAANQFNFLAVFSILLSILLEQISNSRAWILLFFLVLRSGWLGSEERLISVLRRICQRIVDKVGSLTRDRTLLPSLPVKIIRYDRAWIGIKLGHRRLPAVLLLFLESRLLLNSLRIFRRNLRQITLIIFLCFAVCASIRCRIVLIRDVWLPLLVQIGSQFAGVSFTTALRREFSTGWVLGPPGSLHFMGGWVIHLTAFVVILTASLLRH